MMRATITGLWVAAAGVALGAMPNAALSDMPAGIAFVQAPEMGLGVATGSDMTRTIDAARETCMASGALETDCLVSAWCQPAGWSIDLFVMHQEGLHWHEFICGLPDQAMAERVADLLCESSGRPWIMDCMLVQIYDDAGTPRLE
ncbi:MAG: hypothetical protein JJU19_04025 [Pararhodobacter sp.]|nr:hypothetical protein [Pararhodobacter sp.]